MYNFIFYLKHKRDKKMDLEFNSNDFRINRKIVDKAVDSYELEEFDMVEIVDLDTQQSLITLEREDDEILFKFYYYLSKSFQNSNEWFIVDEEILNFASAFFGKLAWDKASNPHIKVLKEYENIEVRLM